MEHKRIFTFWEPREKVPGYINLCIKTWRKFLPDYEIVILDYSNLDGWLGKNYFDKSLYKNFSLAQQADAIRCGILNRHGGIWLDADTIILSDKMRDIFKSDSEFNIVDFHIAYLMAKPNSHVLKMWEEGIHKHVKTMKFISTFRLHKIFKAIRHKFLSWDCLGNSILNPILESVKNDKKLYNRFYIKDLKCRIETLVLQDRSMDVKQKYRSFYFENDNSDKVLDLASRFVFLHNSWTPPEYKKMAEQEFMDSENTLSAIFKKLGI